MKKALITFLWLYSGWTLGSALVFFLAAPETVGPLAALVGGAIAVAIVHRRPATQAALRPEPAA